jgi:hypothetical protein
MEGPKAKYNCKRVAHAHGNRAEPPHHSYATTGTFMAVRQDCFSKTMACNQWLPMLTRVL